jgi:hypothetical protein
VLLLFAFFYVPVYATPYIGWVLIDVSQEPAASIFKYENR